jgi:glutathione S-transferase
MSLKLLYASQSPPSRASLLTIRALGLDVDLVQVNLAAHEHLTTEFLEVSSCDAPSRLSRVD